MFGYKHRVKDIYIYKNMMVKGYTSQIGQGLNHSNTRQHKRRLQLGPATRNIKDKTGYEAQENKKFTDLIQVTQRTLFYLPIHQ